MGDRVWCFAFIPLELITNTSNSYKSVHVAKFGKATSY